MKRPAAERLFGPYWREEAAQADDVRAALHRCRSAGDLPYATRSRLEGRVWYHLARIEMGKDGRDIDELGDLVDSDIRKARYVFNQYGRA